MPHLIRLLRDTDYGVVHTAISSLGELGDSAAVEPITELWSIAPPENDHRITALIALTQLGSFAASEELLKLMQQKDLSSAAPDSSCL